MEKSQHCVRGHGCAQGIDHITVASKAVRCVASGRLAGSGFAAEMVRRQQSKGHKLVFVYEAGPCGF